MGYDIEKTEVRILKEIKHKIIFRPGISNKDILKKD